MLDQLMTGSKSCKAAVVLSPMLDSQQIDDAIIVNGNYQNQSEWINSLSPQMVRQPILLLTSNGDDIATPYQMTLMYNKFSSDSIIHMGGVYHADQNDVFLSITDSGFHATVPFHSQTMEEILRFVNPLLEQPLEMTALPRLYNLSAVAIPALLLLALAFAIRLAAGYAPQVFLQRRAQPFGCQNLPVPARCHRSVLAGCTGRSAGRLGRLSVFCAGNLDDWLCAAHLLPAAAGGVQAPAAQLLRRL